MGIIAYHSIKLTSIKVPENSMLLSSDTRFKDKDEQFLYSAYKRNLESAQALAEKKLFHDAWILLNISVECFFKHIYILIRYELEKSLTTYKKKANYQIDYEGSFMIYNLNGGRKGKKVTVREFSHEIQELWNLIYSFTDLKSDKRRNDCFQGIKSGIPTSSNWIKARYASTDHDKHKNRSIPETWFTLYTGDMVYTFFRL